jgi:hypothetical protein
MIWVGNKDAGIVVEIKTALEPNTKILDAVTAVAEGRAQFRLLTAI